MSRRRRSLIAALVTAIAAAALAPVRSAAQTYDSAAPLPPNTSTAAAAGYAVDLLQPSLDGNPQKPPRFRRRAGTPAEDENPPTNTFTAPSRIGAIPLYGSPPAFGAGNTGFDSSNTPHNRKKAKKPAPPPPPGVPTPETTFEPPPTTDFTIPTTPPPQKPPPPAEVHPNKAATRPGAELPPASEAPPISNVPPEVHPLAAANRPGAKLPVPPSSAYELPTDITAEITPPTSTPPPGTPPLNTLPPGTPQPPLPLAGGDAYAPVGIRGGSFLFFPAVELSSGYDTNPAHVPGGPPSPYFVVAPELRLQSLWSRHSLSATVVGTYTDYTSGALQPSLSRPYLNSTIDGRVDVTRDTQILLQNRVTVSTDNPGSPNLSAGLSRLPINTTVGGTVGVAQNFNRLDFTLRGTIDHATYNNSVLTDGESVSNADRNFNQYAGIARVGYELDPGLKPFVEVQEDERIHDDEFDRNGLRRDSVGTSAKAGAALDLFGSLTGEIAFGYMQRDYQDPSLPTISGAIADGSLIWRMTGLTTAKLTASSVVNESIVPGASGAFSRDVNLQVDHALRRWLIASLKLGYGRDQYVGIDRDDNRYFVSIGLQYMFTRSISAKGEVREDWLTSNTAGVAYNATSVLAGIRLQE